MVEAKSSNPVSLPTWEECKAKVDADTATALEAFIYENEPALTEKAQDFVRKCIPNYSRRTDEQFRGMLSDLIAFVRAPVETTDKQKNWAMWQCIEHGRIFAAHAGCSYCQEGRPADPTCAICDRRFSDHKTVISHDFKHRPLWNRPMADTKPSSKTVMDDARLAVDMREQAESFTDIAGYTLTGRLLRAGADAIERLQQVETTAPTFQTPQFAGLAFRHWSKDPAVPYAGCRCDTCLSVETAPIGHASPNDAVRWICPECTTVNDNRDERCCVGSCKGVRPSPWPLVTTK